ncbi:MAG: hypothetical protein IJB96_04275 [Lachnospira sp.]|nr:hypothetical protein [Lachnospira sp.]
MQVKKIITICLIALMMCLLSGCTGCGDSPEQKAINKDNIARAKENAINYVKEKYNISAEVSDAILDRNYGLFSSTPTSKVLVKMKYDDRNFNVYIDGESPNTNGYDDYQKDSISDAVKSIVAKQLPGVERVIIDGGKMNNIEYSDIRECCDVLYDKYYDGTNLKEVLSDNNYNVYVAFVDKSLSNVSNEDFPELLWDDDDRYEVTLNLISYRDRDTYKQCYEYSVEAEYAVYIEEYCELYGTKKKEYEEYKLNQCGDLYYYVEDDKEDDVEVSKLIKVINASDWKGHGADDATVSSDAYSICASKDTGKSGVHIFFPISKIKNFSEKDTEYAYCEYSKDKYNYSSGSVKNSIIGEYVHRECLPADKSAGESYYFVFLKDK